MFIENVKTAVEYGGYPIGLDINDKEESLTLPVASPISVDTERKLEMMQASLLYLWNNYKTKANHNDYITRQNLVTYSSKLGNFDCFKVDSYYFKEYEKNISNLDDKYKSLKDKGEYELAEYFGIVRDTMSRELEAVLAAGYVVDVKYGYEEGGLVHKNVVSAICLSSVKVFETNCKTCHTVSDHMWLYLNKIDPYGMMIFGSGIENIKIGDEVLFVGTVK